MPSERVQRRIDSLLDRAEDAADRFDWPAVAESARMVLRLDAENEDAIAFLDMVEGADGEDGRTAASGSAPAPGSPEPVDGAGSASSSSDGAPATAADGGQAGAGASYGGQSEAGLTAASGVPTSFAAGRYVVNRFLGEGGKKRVFLAHDETLDRDVAFALIKTEGLDETSRERVRREAQAMGRMGTHPSIMPIYDLGEEPVAGAAGTQPYMVQPLMAGGDVEGLIEEAEGPLELETALRIATQTAQGLSFAHSKGIVHRDLKPGNVWLDEDGSAKIGDFGLAVATDRSRLTVEKVMVGTVSYMPPEQATGGDVTPKADLYSLGAMLYEMCTGRVPFMGDDDIAVISQHINTPPVAPSWHNGQVPKTLDSLILRLMSKDPGERPESADEVLAALEAVDLSAAPDEADEKGTGSLDSMAGGVFVGRHREMDQLKATFEEVLSGRGKMVTLVGEPGIGKTRTAQELSTYASMRGAQVLWGRSYEGGGAPPYWPWVQAVRSHVSATEPQELRAQLGSAGPVIAEIVTDIREKLPDLPAPTPIEDPESARFRLFDSISTFLKQASRNAPLVLMLEDLHWADRPSLMLLEFVARELANSKLMIVGNYRDVELNRRHPLAVTLGELTRERLFERVVLRGLQRHDVERFIEIAAGITPPAALVDTVHAQTEGNPLFVTETVRLLIQEGDIASGQTTASGTTSWEVRIPEGVREVIGRRLDRLSERCNEVLTTAAVIGRQFRFAVLLKLVGGNAAGGNGSGSSAAGSGSAMSPPDSGSSSPTSTTSDPITENMLLDALDEALDGRIIEELPEEVGLYQFTHAQMQETLTSELSANRLVRMHARIATALEDYYSNTAPNAGQPLLEANAAELAEHFAEAEVVLGTEKLLLYRCMAGNAAIRSFAHETASSYFESALEGLSDSTDDHLAGEIWAGAGRTRLAILPRSARPSVIEAMAQAMDIFERLNAGPAAYEMMAVLGELAGENTGGPDLIRRSIDLLPGDDEPTARLWTKLGRFLAVELFDFAGAEQAFERAEQIADHLGDDGIRARIMADRSRVALAQGAPPTQVAEYAARALQLDSGADLMMASQVNFVLCGALLTLGNAEGAREAAIRTMEASKVLNDRNRLAGAHSIAAQFHIAVGELDDARKAARDGLNVDHEDGRVLAPAAAVEYLTGNVKAGDEYLRRIVALAQSGEIGTHLDRYSYLQAVTMRRDCFGGGEFLPELDLELSELDLDRSPAFKAHYVYTVHGEAADAGLVEQLLARLSRERSDQRYWAYGTSLQRLTANLHLVLDQPNEADECFDMAAANAREDGYRPELVFVCLQYAEFLLNRNSPGDREKAVELQDEAMSIARDLGMKPLLERVLAKREIMKA